MNLFESMAHFAGTMSYKIKNALGIKPPPWPYPPQDMDHEIAERLIRKGIFCPLAEINNTKADFSKKDRELVEEYNNLIKKLEKIKNDFDSTGNPAKKDLLLAEFKKTEAILDGNIEEQHKNIEALNVRLIEARTRKEITSDDEWNALLKESADQYYRGFFMPLPKRKQHEGQC